MELNRRISAVVPTDKSKDALTFSLISILAILAWASMGELDCKSIALVGLPVL